MDEARRSEGALDETLANPSTMPGGPRSSSSSFVRSTVLPAARPEPASERFATLERLGAGGMGEVVLVADRDIERKVAIKRLRPDQRSEPALQRFAEEVRIIGQLEHPNITPVHDVGVDEDGQHYFVMKYVEGETLESVIARLKAGDPAYQQRFGYEERVQLFLSILNAIQYAHAHGVIHRDLKPSNIMVGPFGAVTVMDWGLARRKDTPEPAARGALLGTPLYMSPEQAAGEIDRVDERSDLFSLSLLFCELMTLTHPLADCESTQEIVSRLVTEGVDNKHLKLAFARAGAPVEYAVLLARGLEKDPARRYPSVQAMIDEVQAARAGKFGVSCHVTLSKRALADTHHFIDRHPYLYSVLFFGAIAAVLWAGWHGLAQLLH